MSDYNADRIRQLALEYLTYFVPLERENSSDTYSTGDNTPQELKDLCYKAHGDIMPDDYKYNYIVDSLEAIADSETDDLEDLSCELEADIYYWDLLKWLSSNLTRASYIDEYIQEYYTEIPAKDFDTFTFIGLGQITEKQEVFNLVLQSLVEIAESLEEDNIEDE